MAYKYTIRKDGRIWAASDIPNLGYSQSAIKSMEACGYHLYIDGKRAKTSSKEATPKKRTLKVKEEEEDLLQLHF